MRILYRYNLIYVALLLILTCNHKKQPSQEETLAAFFAKPDVRIIVTDSGLGGLSVAADLYERLQQYHVFQNAEVIFFNAQPHLNSGYNSMETTEQKVQVFNNALVAMQKELKPDAILIACNTLSVLYDYTPFSKTSDIPVIGIVETGINLIEREMNKTDSAQVMIFATETTVQQNRHKIGLTDRGIPGERIYTQACPSLAGRIERGPQSDTTKALVHKYVQQILQHAPVQSGKWLVSYNCTHYGYVNDLFQQAFKEYGVQIEQYLDPNPLMADFIFTEDLRDRYQESEVKIKLISQPELTPGKQAAIFGLIEPGSPATANALLDYQFVPDFFEWKSIAGNKTAE